MSINRNGYISRFIPPEKRDFLNYLDQLKYEETIKNPDRYFQNVKIINFDIINHVSSGNLLEKRCNKHFAVKANDFVKYPGRDKENIIGGALRNQNKSKQLFFAEKKVVLDHFQNNK